MYKMSSLLKVIVMKVNGPIFHVNGRFTVVLCLKTPHWSPIPTFYRPKDSQTNNDYKFISHCV